MFRTILLGALLACAQMAHAQVLWQGLSAGMTEEAVRRALPAAQAVNNPITKMASGAQGKLRVPGLDYMGKPAEATLFFIGDWLGEVQFTHQPPQGPTQGREAYNELLAALRAKHGQELHAVNARTSSEANWVVGGAILTLLGVFEGNTSWINITYSARAAR